MSAKKLIDLYPYLIEGDEIKFLLFKRAKGKIYEGQWRMVGGKVRPDEFFWQAALRELKEETGLTPEKFWTIPSTNSFYEASSDAIHHIPAFAAELSFDKEPILDDEHTSFEWVYLEEALKRIRWPEQKRLLKLTHSLLSTDQILEDWLVSADLY